MHGLMCWANNSSIISNHSPKRCHLLFSGIFFPSFERQSHRQQSKLNYPALISLKHIVMNRQWHPKLSVGLWVCGMGQTQSVLPAAPSARGEKMLNAQGPTASANHGLCVPTSSWGSCQSSQRKEWWWDFDFFVLKVPGWGFWSFPGSWHFESLSSKREMPREEKGPWEFGVRWGVPAPGIHPPLSILPWPHSTAPHNIWTQRADV